MDTGIICHLSEKKFKSDPFACNCKSAKLCRSDAEMFDIVVKHIKASVRFLITKSRPENVTHEKQLQSRPFSIHPHLFSRLLAIPNGILQLTSLTPYPTHAHTYTHPGEHISANTRVVWALRGPWGGLLLRSKCFSLWGKRAPFLPFLPSPTPPN